MDYKRIVTGCALILIGIVIILFSNLEMIIGGLIFMIFGSIIIFNKFENQIEEIKTRGKKNE